MEHTFEELLKKANAGDPAAMCWVGNCYHKGQGVARDDAQAVAWYKRAVAAESPSAMLILGRCYLGGIGTEKDEAAGLALIRRAADAGYGKAQAFLDERAARATEAEPNDASVQTVDTPQESAQKDEAEQSLSRARALHTGIGAEKDTDAAIAMYEALAEADVAEAQDNLALFYRFGDGVEKNADLAAYWYLRAQKNGNTDALNALSDLEQTGGLSVTYLKMRRAILQDDGLAAYELWQALSEKTETEKRAFYFCKLGAEAGNTQAQAAYADYFEKGLFVEQSEQAQFAWLAKAAQGGDPEARYRYGCYLLREKREREAVRLLCAAADGGHLQAQLKMGGCLEYGIGTGRDAAEAARIYRQASAKSSRACYLLGKLYLTGRLTDAEPRTALTWYRKGYDMDKNVLCAFGIGQCTRDGIGEKQDAIAANRLFIETVPALEKLAAEKDPIGMACLAELYFYGLGGKALSPRKAVELYAVAAEQGEPVAQLGLGDCYTRSNMLRDPKKAAHWYARAADSGIPAAQYCYGLCLRDGTGVERDIARSKELFLLAAKGGHAEAQYALGEYYAKALYDTKQDYAEAMQWYTGAAESGHAGARYALGVCYERGVGTEKKLTKAVEWYEKAAEIGSAAANCRLGELYSIGEGVAQSDTKAAEHFKQAAVTGHVGACYQLGLCYEGGRGVEKDPLLAFRWYEQAGELPDAKYARGTCLAAGLGTKKDPAAAFALFESAAEARQVDAMFRAGYCLLTGSGTPVSAKKALSYLTRAAEQGQMEAAYTLGVCYADGRVVTQSPEQAFRWFETAAESGHADARCRLGVCYERGFGVEKNATRAAECYQLAAEAESDIACYRLARCYEYGIGKSADKETALAWYEKSAALGNAAALTVLGVRGDPKKAEERLLAAVKRGSADAAWELAVRTERMGGEHARSEVARYLQTAAAAGHVKATYHLGLALETGAGVMTDHKAALERYQRAAELGYPPAMYRLGLCLGAGRGTTQNVAAAREWLTRAKDKGVREAAEALAILK